MSSSTSENQQIVYNVNPKNEQHYVDTFADTNHGCDLDASRYLNLSAARHGQTQLFEFLHGETRTIEPEHQHRVLEQLVDLQKRHNADASLALIHRHETLFALPVNKRGLEEFSSPRLTRVVCTQSALEMHTSLITSVIHGNFQAGIGWLKRRHFGRPWALARF